MNNYKNYKKCIHDPGLGDMNIVAVPRDKKQPTNLLKLKNYNEEWDGDKLINFYSSNQIPMI